VNRLAAKLDCWDEVIHRVSHCSQSRLSDAVFSVCWVLDGIETGSLVCEEARLAPVEIQGCRNQVDLEAVHSWFHKPDPHPFVSDGALFRGV